MHITQCYCCSTLACITGALWAKGGERGIFYEAQNEGRRKIKHRAPPLVSCFAQKMPRSPRLAHKAPVMQAAVHVRYWLSQG